MFHTVTHDAGSKYSLMRVIRSDGTASGSARTGSGPLPWHHLPCLFATLPPSADRIADFYEPANTTRSGRLDCALRVPLAVSRRPPSGPLRPSTPNPNHSPTVFVPGPPVALCANRSPIVTTTGWGA